MVLLLCKATVQSYRTYSARAINTVYNNNYVDIIINKTLHIGIKAFYKGLKTLSVNVLHSW